MAEVYWDLEWRLQQHGFNFTYDKRLYDRLHGAAAQAVREHLQADLEYQNRSARFLENHDEPRAAGTFPFDMHRAAAVITFFVPGLRFFQEGQMEGWRTHASMHLGRRPKEPTNPQIRAFYELLYKCLRRPEVHEGSFHLWQPRPAWDGNPTWNNFICFSWHDDDGHCCLAITNYSGTQGQCYLPIDLVLLAGETWKLSDLLGPARYQRSGDEMRTRGLYLDMPAWGYHFFDITPVPKQAERYEQGYIREPEVAGSTR
jgi:hypothetical protein